MSYSYSISPREISISPGALAQLRWDYDLQRGIPQEIIQILGREFSIQAEVTGYTTEGQPEFSFELLTPVASEHLGLKGVAEELERRLKYAENQSFELTDENGAYMNYHHLGYGSREDY